MSIPIDRLYDFLYNFCNRDNIIIYQFQPYGSRKLDDLTMLFQTRESPTWLELMTTPCMIMHDQEPLMYDLYTKKDFYDFLQRTKCAKFYPNIIPEVNMNLMTDMHLRCCVGATNNVYDQTLLCHSEKNSQDLELYTKNNFIGVYYWSHALIARDWYRYAQWDPKLKINLENITSDFLIYNRAWTGTREYRLTLAEMLANQNLVNSCNIKFSEVDNQVHYTQHQFANPNLAIVRKDLHNLYPSNTYDATASADYENQDYATSAVEVVLETLFDDSRHHLTEKTLRPIACGRPFILAATAGSLKYLQQYGFETFHGLIDETYDSIANPRARLSAIVQEIKRISSLKRSDRIHLWTSLYEISQRNQKLFFSDHWHNNIIKEFCDNFESAWNQMTITGLHQRRLDSASQHDPDMIRWRATSKSAWGGPSVEERDQLARWIEEKNSSC